MAGLWIEDAPVPPWEWRSAGALPATSEVFEQVARDARLYGTSIDSSAFGDLSTDAESLEMVFIEARDPHYHHAGCSRMGEAESSTLGEAVMLGLLPCRLCLPRSPKWTAFPAASAEPSGPE